MVMGHGDNLVELIIGTPHLNLTRKKITLYIVLERRHATRMLFYSPRPEVFAYWGLDDKIANLSLGYQ